MQVNVRYFAGLREATGLEAEALDLPDGGDRRRRPRAAGSVTLRWRGCCPPAPWPSIAPMSRRDAARGGDELVFIPPLGGG